MSKQAHQTHIGAVKSDTSKHLWKPIETAPEHPIDIFYVNGTWAVPATGILRRALRRGMEWETFDGLHAIPAQFVILWKDSHEQGDPDLGSDLSMHGAVVSDSKPRLKLVD